MAAYREQQNPGFDPFNSDHPAGHFFPGGNRQELLDQLIAHCTYDSDLVVVTGPLGCGKSTLAQWLALCLDDEFVAVRVQATLFMSAEQLLEAACGELGLETDPDAEADELLRQLDQYADSLHARSRTLQLLVDDAHELGQEALSCLFELLARQADSNRLGEDGVKAVLFGEMLLLDQVEQLAPSACRVLELKPLDLDETVDYLEFRLTCAGFAGRLPIGKDAISVIHARARGMPGALNALARDALGESVLSRQSRSPLRFIERHLVASSVLFGVLVLALFFVLESDRDPASVSSAVVATTPQSGSVGQARVQVPLEIKPPSPASAEPLLAVGSATRGNPDPEEPLTGDEVSAPTARESAGTYPVRSIAGAIEPKVDEDPGSVTVAPGAAVSEADRPNLGAPQQDLTQLSTAMHTLLSWPPERFTLQLLGSHSENNVRNFIARHGGSYEMSYFESRHQDQPWYVVVTGSFPDRRAAQDAIDQLPPPLKELKPWARNLSDIQTAIRHIE